MLTGEGSDETLGGYDRYRYTVCNMALGRAAEGLTGSFGRRLGSAIMESLPPGSRWRSRLRRTALTRPATLDDLYFDNFAVFDRRAIRAPPRARAPGNAGRDRSVRRRPPAAAIDRRRLRAEQTALRRHLDVPARAADEAGPDEHGGVHREPRAVPRPSARRVHRHAARAPEAPWAHHEVHPARGDARLPARRNPFTPQDGIPRPGRTLVPRGTSRDHRRVRPRRTRGESRPVRRERTCASS